MSLSAGLPGRALADEMLTGSALAVLLLLL
jgi:hypothetical protein